jgi:inner membrane protein
MDNVTHTLTGIALGQAGLKGKTRFAILALIIGSNLPDIDVIAVAGGKLNYLKYHRGITHSLLGLTVLSAILTTLIYAFGRRASPRKNTPNLNLKWLFVVCWIATSCHVLMDYTNQYGVRPFLPFSGRWVALDIMPIVGPYVLLLLFLGLGIPAVLRLVSEEVGARKNDDSSRAIRAGALFSLCGILVVWGLREVSHKKAVELLDANDYGQEAPIRVGAFPSAINPFGWTGVAETRSSYYLLHVSALAGGIDADQAEVLHKATFSTALAAAQKSRGAKIFLDFARFPSAMVLGSAEGFNVHFRDLRFASPNSNAWSFALEVQLNKDLQVRHESFSFFRPTPAD